MANNDTTIYKLRQVVSLFGSRKKSDELNKDDYSALKTAINYFGDEYHFDDYQSFLDNLPISVVIDLINKLSLVEQSSRSSSGKTPQCRLKNETEKTCQKRVTPGLIAKIYKENPKITKEELEKKANEQAVEICSVSCEDKDKKDKKTEEDEEDKSQEKKQTTEPKSKTTDQETSTLPPQLESLVAQYEQNQLDNAQNDGSVNKTTEAIKRATTAMRVRKQHEAVFQNAARNQSDSQKYLDQQEKNYQEQLTTLSDPKSTTDSADIGNRENIQNVLHNALHSYLQNRTDLNDFQKIEIKSQANNIVSLAEYLGLTGALDISNQNDLLIALESSIHYTAPDAISTQTGNIINEIDQQEKTITELQNNINQEQLKLSGLLSKLQKTTDEDQIKEIQKQIDASQQSLSEYSTQINQSEVGLDKKLQIKIEQSQKYFQDQANKIVNNQNAVLYQKNAKGEYVEQNNEDGTPKLNRDLKDEVEDIKKNVENVHNNLTNIAKVKGKLPNTNYTFTEVNNIEKAIRKDIPGLGLHLNTSQEAAKVSEILKNPNAQNSKLSAEAVDIYGKGLNSQNFDQVIEFARNNPNSALGKLYSQNPDAFGKLRQQLSHIESSNSPQNIYKLALDHAKNNPNSALGKLYSQKPQDFQKLLNENKITGKALSELNNIRSSTLASSIKNPINRVDKVFNGVNNRLTSFFGKYDGFIKTALDPIGTFKSYLGRKAGETIVKNFGKFLSKEFSETLLKEGIKGALKKLGEQAIKKLGQEGLKLAAKLGLKGAVQATAQALNFIPGLGLIVAAALELLWPLIEKTLGALKNGFNSAWRSVFGEDFDVKAAAITAAAVTVGTFTALGTIVIATISGIVFTLIVATYAMFIFHISAVIMGPVLSSLAQLDSVEKVVYSTNTFYTGPINCSSMPWPFDNTYYITQGPNTTGTHHGGIAQSADFGTPIGTPIKSMTDGQVIYAGNNNDGYGNSVHIQAQTDSGESFEIIYGHFSSVSVKTGSSVKAGQLIGLSGNTGYSTGPHLHVGYIGNVPYNSCPAGGFQIDEGCGITNACNQP